MKLSGEVANAVIKGDEDFKKGHRITVDEKYRPEEKFNIDESSFFWKHTA
jgi:hypothetical protein